MSRVSQARNLGKYFLLIDNMLVVLGFFVVFPLISIRFVDQMGWAAVMVGIALGLRQFIQQGLGIFGGAIADRFGAKPMIVTGMLMRSLVPCWAVGCCNMTFVWSAPQGRFCLYCVRHLTPGYYPPGNSPPCAHRSVKGWRA